MESLCEEVLQGGDAGLFLVGLSEEIERRQESGGAETALQAAAADQVARTLLQEKYQAILLDLGWDLLPLFCPYLHPSHPHSDSWQLVEKIVTVCPPKEMILALLEQMEALSVRKPLLVFVMLDLLKNTMDRLAGTSGPAQVIDSALGSVFNILRPLVRASTLRGQGSGGGAGESSGVGEGGREEEEEKEIEDREGEGEEREMEEEGEEGEIRQGGDDETARSEHEGVASDGSEAGDPLPDPYAVSTLECARRTLEFVRPFSEELSRSYEEDRGRGRGHGKGWGWSGRQRECIAMLLALLDYPLVRSNLSTVRKGVSLSSSSLVVRNRAEEVMSTLVTCHCDCISVLSWTPPPPLSEDLLTSDPPVPLPPLGVSCFAYLLFVEKMCYSYLPQVYTASYLFHTSVRHVCTLLDRKENSVIKKGLKLLDSLLSLVLTPSLPLHLLEDKVYIKLAQSLVKLMTLSQQMSIRKTSVKLFQCLLSRFEPRGRHRYYRSLLNLVDHSGVKGLLVHAVKNEVDDALKGRREGSPFFGQGLATLLEQILRVEEKIELLKEFDCLMSSLNFLRYILIRDKREQNHTGVWDILDSLSAQFLSPLRSLLAGTRARCRNELQLRRYEAKGSKQGTQREDPQVTVEIPNDSSLPTPSLQDEIEILQVAEQQMDMMESVIVRVEELT